MCILPKCECGTIKKYMTNGLTGTIELVCPRCQIRCSVCGDIKHRENYCDGLGRQDRTNCRECYENLADNWDSLRSHATKNYRSFNSQANEMNDIAGSAITVGELKAMLQDLPDDAPIVVVNHCAENGETFYEPEISDYRKFNGKKLYTI